MAGDKHAAATPANVSGAAGAKGPAGANQPQPSLPVRLALCGLAYYLQSGREPTLATPSVASLLASAQVGDGGERELYGLVRNRQAGAFVSLHEGGELRGCIGTIAATAPCVAEEILRNAVAAGTRDPRFPPVEAGELAALECSVDVLGAAEPVAGPEELDVRRYGVIVSRGWRRGLLLPDLEGVSTPEQQIAIARQKGGIGPSEPYRLERVEVVRYV
jgi:AmmeMemoRadiSam system protein A